MDAYFAVPVEERPSSILLGLYEARIEFLVVGAMAAVLQGVRTTSRDERVDTLALKKAGPMGHGRLVRYGCSLIQPVHAWHAYERHGACQVNP